MMMARSIVRGDCPCIFQPLSSETVVFSISPLLLRYTPQCYGARQGRRGIVQACYIADILIDRKEIKKRGYIVSMYRSLYRAEDEAQTRDPQLGRLMLYQLSYFRNFFVGKDGFEPPKA